MMATHANDGSFSEAEGSFVVQAARLVEMARANERAVRDLEEAVHLLANNMEDLEGLSHTADTLRGLAEGIEAAGGMAEAVADAAAGLETAQAAADEALVQMGTLDERALELAQRWARLDERLERLEAALNPAVERAERIEAIEDKLDRLLGVLTDQADAYTGRVEPQLARLEAVAERMDTPALADELADVLATNLRVLELAEKPADSLGSNHE